MGRKEILEPGLITRRNFIKTISSSFVLVSLGGLKVDAAGKGHNTFCTAINCIDGRVQRPVYDYMKNLCKVNYVDMITAPGPDKIISQGESMSEYIMSEVEVSVKKHASKMVAIVGHYDCKGNPVPNEEHLAEIQDSVRKIKSWNLPINVIGLWVNENWGGWSRLPEISF